jgi:threonine dehydratase
MDLPTYADVLAAVPIVRRWLKPTPLYEWPALSQLLGCRYLLKHENHTPTTAFKVRGGIHLVARLPEEQKRRGIIGCTTGNHGQSLAYACRLFGVRCVMVVPANNNPDKNAAMRALGAELIEHGRDFDEARAHCEAIRAREGLRYVHSANEPDLIAGVGTYAQEIFDDCPEPDVILAPIGLGSGICGTALVAAARRPQTRVIGVQSELAPAVTLSWRAGRVIETGTPQTFAEGMATRVPADMTLELMRRHVHDIVLVSDPELREAIRLLLRLTHNLAEGAGAASTAAAFRLRDQLAGKTVVGVLSGGNLDLRELGRILAEGTATVKAPGVQRFRAVLFDFDGTLADSYPAITASINHVRAAYGLGPLPESEVRPHVGRGPENLLEHTIPGADLVKDLLRYRAHHPSVLRSGTRLLPGAAESLAALKRKGLLLAVCSNKPRIFTEQLLDILEIKSFFDVVLGPEDVPRRKPAPDMLKEGLRRLGVPAAEALYVGDMTVDIETARGAGTAVWVVPTGSDDRAALEAAQPDRLLGSLAEVAELVPKCKPEA